MHQDRGFQKKSRAEIVSDMKSKARNLFGSDINLAINSPLGILIQLFSWPMSLLWFALEKVYNAAYINTSTGQDLDNLAKNIGITRIMAAKASGEIEFVGDDGTIIPGGFLVETDSNPPIQFKTTEEVIIDNGSATVEIVAVEAGSSGNVSGDTITEIVNPISGLDEANNPNPTAGGRNKESDTEFRERYKDSLDRPGGSTANSIRANVLEETEATACVVLENTSMEESEEGLAPKSFETIVLGGEDEEIATAIFDKKPAGMEAYGEESFAITDDAGLEKIVAYSLAAQKDIYVEAEIKVDENYPADGEEQIKDAVVEYIGGVTTEGDSMRGLSIYNDVIRARLISQMYTVDGVIDVIKMELGVDGEVYAPENIEIEFREVARTEPAFINVQVVD